MGRFLQPDPIRFAGGINFYRYGRNNPIKFIDSFGLCEWNTVKATREGLVGGTTASGLVIEDDDIFVALPDRSALGREVELSYGGNNLTTTVQDVGPWNTHDPYWNTNSRPQAESGTDTRGRPTNGAGIDLSNEAFRQLGLKDNDTIKWRFK